MTPVDPPGGGSVGDAPGGGSIGDAPDGGSGSEAPGGASGDAPRGGPRRPAETTSRDDGGLDAAGHGALLAALDHVSRERPLDDKLLVCRPRGSGREILHALATAGAGWVGFRVQTPWELATELIGDELAAAGLELVDRFEEMALLDEAIDATLRRPEGAVLRALGDAAGFREALAGAIRELRLAGVGAGAVARAGLDDRAKRDALAAIQRRYETLLAESGRVDRSDALARAGEALESGASLPADLVLLMPGQHGRGLRGRFLRLLVERGAEVLPSDPVLGLDVPPALITGPAPPPVGLLSWLHAVDEAPSPGPAADLFTPARPGPEIDLFAAASPVDELREALRRTLHEGLAWDDVEIVATDWRTYGTVLDSLAPRLGIGVTHAAGLPVSRTRPGRALAGYLRWIQEDFAEEILRGLCHASLLRAPAGDGGDLSGARLARLLRSLRIGWGRERYLQQIRWRLEGLDAPPSARERARWTTEQIAERRRRKRTEFEAVLALVEAVLEATPPTPDRLGSREVRVSAAGLARGALALLDFVPDDREIDREALRRLREALHRVATTLDRETGFHSALATLQRTVDVRVPSPSAHGRVPWSSAGGYLHFADLDHGGLSGRRRVFVVGLDAGRFPGSGADNPLLSDRDRRRLSSGQLPGAAETLDETRHRLAALLARLRGKVTMSSSAWEASEGRQLAPAALLLQAVRLQLGDPAADYEALHGLTRPVSGPVPRDGGRVEDSDVWLSSLSHDDLLLHGVDAVRHGFTELDRGLQAVTARQRPTLNAWNGAVSPRPELLDPRRAPDMLLSATRLESLATCPLRYFYAYVLGLRPPDELRFEPDVWLDPLERGSLFHRVYERVLQEARQAGVEWGDDLDAVAARVLEAEIRRTCRQVPPPSQAVMEAESQRLRDDLAVFLDMLRQQRPRWLATEWTFGFDAAEHGPAELEVPGGRVRLRGAIDRIDEVAGGLRIVDYKTGSRWGYGEGTGVYNGGRRLQHALYSHATEVHLERPVTSAEYHFPTHKGDGGIEPYPRAALGRWPEILGHLLEMVARGHFPPAPDEKQPPCKFCDYRPICRVQDRHGDVVSPPVLWGARHCPTLDEYQPLRRVRGIDD